MRLLVKCNVGSQERILRNGVGLLTGIAAMKTKDHAWRWALGALSFASFATAGSRYCPLYHVLGVNNCQAARRDLWHLPRRL